MKGFTGLLVGIFATVAFSWMGLAFIPNLQIGHLEPQTDEEGKDPYPAPKSGMAERGRRVYVANGCFYCHSQQVRADYAGSDIDRKWGQRRSAPRDYIFDRPVELGRLRMGPDLANIGHRAPTEDQNAPPGGSPSPAGGTTPANASPPVPASGNSPANTAPNQSTPPAPPQPPGNSSPAATAKAQPAAQPPNPAPPPGTPASPPASAAAIAKATASPTNVPVAANANAAASGASPAAQQAPSPVATAATSLEASPSSSPTAYSAAWHHLHLYSPRSINLDSNMPAYKFLYVRRRIAGQTSAEALKLHGEEAPPEGWEVVPSFDADCLVAYLLSLDQSHALKEVKSMAAPASSPSPGKSAK